MKDKIVLNSGEHKRVLVLNQLEAGVLSPAQTGQLLGLAERQLRRLRARYRQEGAGSLAHGNRGRRPVNAVDPDVAERLTELARTTYVGLARAITASQLGRAGAFRGPGSGALSGRIWYFVDAPLAPVLVSLGGSHTTFFPWKPALSLSPRAAPAGSCSTTSGVSRALKFDSYAP